jgi:riboflavin synthase alpha subunit
MRRKAMGAKVPFFLMPRGFVAAEALSTLISDMLLCGTDRRRKQAVSLIPRTVQEVRMANTKAVNIEREI